MNGDRFDQFTRLVARQADRHETRRSILRAAASGISATALGKVHGSAEPSRRSAIRIKNQDAAVDPLIDDLAFQLEYDIDKIFAYVRDNISYHPYAGVLRGPRGTLWGLSGNAADQALLLTALLNASQIKTRFVIGPVTDTTADGLEASLRLDADGVRAWAERVLAPVVQEDDIDPVDPTTDEENILAMLTKVQQRFQDIIDRQSRDGVATVLGALADAGITLPEPETAIPDLERSEHIWVQYASGQEWVDLDPSIPNAEPGTVYAEATETREQLAEELFHRISMRLVAEKVADGVPAREELLAFEAKSAELVGVPITLMHPNADSLKAAGVAIQNIIGGYRNFIPSLIVGTQSIAGTPVTFVTGDGAVGAFDETTIEGDTLGEWLEFDIHTPNGHRQVSREIFDRVGFARRGAGTIDLGAISPVELVDTGSGAPYFPPITATWSIGIVSGVVPWTYLAEENASEDSLIAMSRAIHIYHHLRDALAFDNADLNAYQFVIDEPNVTAVMQAKSTNAAGEQVSTLLMDLIQRHLAVVPVGDSASDGLSHVTAGVFGHAIERAMIETTGVELLGLKPDDVISVGRVFEEAERQGIPIRVLTPDNGDTAQLDVGEAASRRIKAALAEGYAVIVPERSVAIGAIERSGWWLVDPIIGATWDQLDDGRGESLVDYAYIIAKILICAAAGFELLGLISLAHTYAAGNQLQVRWARNRAMKLAVAGNACFLL